MKKVLLVGLVVAMFSGCSYVEHHYTRKSCKVIDINDGIATILDKQGNVWDIYDETLRTGDIVDLKMFDNNTIDNIEDDEIIEIK